MEKRQELIGYVLHQLNFNQKTRIFLKILKNHYLDTFKKYPELENEFENIRDLRNKLAHASLDTSIDFLKTKPNFVRLQFAGDGKLKSIDLREDYMKKKISEAFNVFMKITNITAEISGNKSFALHE